MPMIWIEDAHFVVTAGTAKEPEPLQQPASYIVACLEALLEDVKEPE